MPGPSLSTELTGTPLPHRFEDMKRGVAPHIHRCFAAAKQSEADAELDRSYIPTQCRWETCQEYSKTWSSRRGFVTHVQMHIRVARACRWVDWDGVVCCEDGVSDWPTHLARRHSTNMRDKATVNYCYICSEW